MNKYKKIQIVILVMIYILLMIVFPLSMADENPIISMIILSVGLGCAAVSAVTFLILWLEVKSRGLH